MLIKYRARNGMTGQKAEAPESGQNVMDELVQEGELMGNKPALHPDNLKATERSNWINLRQGDRDKGTGLAGYVDRFQGIFSQAWPTMNTQDKKDLAAKYRQFYDADLPWIGNAPQREPIQSQDPIIQKMHSGEYASDKDEPKAKPAPKLNGSAVRAQAFHLMKAEAELWTMGAKNRGLHGKAIGDLSLEQCQEMIHEVEQLKELRDRF
jgi:hypothetical protein